MCTTLIGVLPLDAGRTVAGLDVMDGEYEVSTSGHWHRPKTVRQNRVEVLVPIVIWRRSCAKIGPSRPIAPELAINRVRNGNQTDRSEHPPVTIG